jgi:hypothetical protein
MQRRSFMLVLATGGAMIALPGCNSMPASAIAAWQKPGEDQTDPRLRALSWALLAPNPHNLQSWIADIREPGLIRLSVDLQRLLPATDPPNRQILIGCGAFLELLCMASAQLGQRAEVTLLPEGDYSATGVDAKPFATVRMTADAAIQPDPLFAAVPLRRTNRAPYSAQVPSAALLTQLKSAAQRPGITLHTATDPAKVDRLRKLATAGYRVEFGTAATWTETANAMRVGTDAVAAEPSGVSVLGTMAWWGSKLGMLDPASLSRTDGVAAKTAVDTSVDAAQNTHAWAWLISADNSRTSQIEAGRAYLRMDLAAASLGLAIQPNSQVLQEFPEMAELYTSFHEEVGANQPSRVQMFVRLGYASRPEPAPRRPLGRLVRA